MTIGDVFARAWDLWRRSIGWLILAGLVVGAILALTFAIIYGILLAVVFGPASTAGNDLLGSSGSSVNGLAVGLGALGLILYVIAMFLIQTVAITFYGGMFEMVIGAYRRQRDVRFSDLFAGFRHFNAYLVYALVLLGVSLGFSVLGLIPFLGSLIAFVVSIWLSVIWMYVLPLIADQGVGFMEAAGRSKQMVGSSGWWWTFGMVVLLGIVSITAFIVILFVGLAFYRTNESAGIVIGILLFLLFAVFFPPYAICYVSVLYIASGGDIAPAPASGGRPGIPPAPPAPPAYGPPAPPVAGGQVPGAYGGAPGVPRPGGDDAWKAAADPLARQAPPPLAAPSSESSPQQPAGGSAPEETAATEPRSPEAPEPPTPPSAARPRQERASGGRIRSRGVRSLRHQWRPEGRLRLVQRPCQLPPGARILLAHLPGVDAADVRMLGEQHPHLDAHGLRVGEVGLVRLAVLACSRGRARRRPSAARAGPGRRGWRRRRPRSGPSWSSRATSRP